MATTALRTTIFILNPNALRKALTEKSGIKLVDARPAAEFAKGHLPGAINLLWEDFCESPTCPVQPILHSPGYWGSLCTERLQALAQELADRGLSPEDRIIVVGNGKRDKGREGRIAWMLAYMGAKNVGLLDRGLLEMEDLFTLEAAADRGSSATWTLTLAENRRCTMEDLAEIKASGESLYLVDTRSHKEFIGDSYDYQPRRGRIPGSHLFAYDKLFQSDGSFISRETYLSQLNQEARAANLVSYCEVGVRAALYALLHEIYTGAVMRVYDGSIMEWGTNQELPVVTGEPA